MTSDFLLADVKIILNSVSFTSKDFIYVYLGAPFSFTSLSKKKVGVGLKRPFFVAG